MSVLAAEGVAFDAEAGVVVVGGGAAGLVAALAATEAGADVLVLERDAVPRGSTALSAGLVPAAGTRFQRAAGIADDPAQFARDIMAKAGGEPDPDLVRFVTAAAAPALEWLADSYGLPFSVLEGFRYPGHAANRMHGLPSRSGLELIDALRAAAERVGIALLCQAEVTGLFAGPDRSVRGVALRRPDGSTDRVGCGALVLACNGYGGDPALVRRHIPDLAGALYFGHPGNRGDALRWGGALGCAMRDLSGHQGHGSVAHPSGILITWATITEGGIQVNTAGRRFSDESAGYSEQAAKVVAQPDGIAVTVFDGRIAGIARQFEDFRAAEGAGAIQTAADAPTLARLMHLPEEALAATMADVSRLKAAGARDGFGRDFAGLPQLAPPLHAVRVTGALFHTQGGIVVDRDARALDTNGQSLPNLFAAGGAAAGVSGSRAAGYLSGNGLLTAVTLGRAAGAAAARLSHG